jgi:cytochrome o ubiquinol oxidase operon protein cyoD
MDRPGHTPTEARDTAPGESTDHPAVGIGSYFLGLTLAAILTIASFWAAQTHLIYAPGIPIALTVLAIAQMGVHLVFFLHITTGRDNTNNVLALAFGVLIVGLIVIGSLWIMANLDRNMMPPGHAMQMQE